MLADLRRVQEEFAADGDGRALLRVGALPLLMLEIVPRALAFEARILEALGPDAERLLTALRHLELTLDQR